MTEEYSFASGLAELYERYCNLDIVKLKNPFYAKDHPI